MKLPTSVRILAVIGCASVTMAGCASSVVPREPEATVRQSMVSAPADLQLVCASQAASRFGISKERILPVDSRGSGVAAYEVELRLPAGKAICVINADAQVVRLERV